MPTSCAQPGSEIDVFTQPVSPSGARVIRSPNRAPSSHPQHVPLSHLSRSAPAGWSVYFPDGLETDQACRGRSTVVTRLRDCFLTEHWQRIFPAIPENSFALPFDCHQISHSSSPSVLRSISDAIHPNPDEALSSIGLAACRAAERLSAVSNTTKFSTSQDLPVSRQNRPWPRLYNYTPLSSMRSLRGNSVGKFVSIRGTIVRVSNTRQQLVSMQFECGRCSGCQLLSFTDYKYSAPANYSTQGCRSRSFILIRDTVETVEWQKIRVQELQEKDDDLSRREEGRIPRTIDAKLLAELIDTCIPGDVVTLVALPEFSQLKVESLRIAGRSVYTFCILRRIRSTPLVVRTFSHAKEVYTSLAAASTPIGRQIEESETLAIHRVIREVVREKDSFGYLVQSLVPSIYSHEILKAGILLSPVGGAPKERLGPSGSESVSIRTDIHCLIVWDPRLGKSQMLKALANVAPRGAYVCGNTLSTAELTVTVVREASGDFALEAGALVLGNRGICCIDEFDKMEAEHGALLEAMEQQSVSVAKAGLPSNLSARTTVIAAANPVGAHYDRSRTVCEKLKVALPLLSRFDLAFILVDKADTARDRFTLEHVMKMFRSRSIKRNPATGWRNDGRARSQDPNRNVTNMKNGTTEPGTHQNGTRKSLPERVREMKVRESLPPSLFRQYISYAQTHVHSELSSRAKNEFQNTNNQMRKTAYDKLRANEVD